MYKNYPKKLKIQYLAKYIKILPNTKSIMLLCVSVSLFVIMHAISQAQNLHQNTQQEIKKYELKEGRDFITLENPIPNARNTVIEVFSYACPFCYRYSKIMPQLINALPKNVEFRPYHLEKKGDYGNLASQVFAVLLNKDKKENISITDTTKSAFAKAQSAYFNAYNVDKERWGSGKNPQAFLHTGLDSAGVKIEEFYSLLQEPSVQKILRSWEAGCDIAIIQGVPAFVVNGKYLIYTKSIASLVDLEYKIIELLKK